MLKKYLLLIAVLLTSAFYSLIASAQVGSLSAKVIRIDVTDKNIYGGCIVKLNKKVADASVPLDCPGEWVSFGCNGIFNSKDFAYHKLDLAKSALESGHDLVLTIDDFKKDNGGYCFSEGVGLTNKK
jgi:hypothetical protein